MKRRLKFLVMRMLALGDAYPTPLTDKAAIQLLMDRLAPLSSARKLIRMGPAGDGGYLLPDDLEGIEGCFSPGVFLISGFEKQCAQRGMKVFLADASVERPAETHPLFHFTKKHVGVTSDAEFTLLRNDRIVDASYASGCECRRLALAKCWHRLSASSRAVGAPA